MYIEEECHHGLGRDAAFLLSRALSNHFGDENKRVTWTPKVMPLFGKKLCDVIEAQRTFILLE